MVSPLSPQQFQQTPNFGQQLLGAVAQGQGIQANRQNMAAQQQAMDLRQQSADVEMDEVGYQQELRKIKVLRNLAANAKQIPPDQRQKYVMNSAPALESLGFDIGLIAQQPLDDRSLDEYVSYLDSAIPQDEMQVRVQSSQVLDNGTTVQVLTDGSTRVTDPAGKQLQGDERAKAIRDAQEYGVKLQSDRAGGRAGAVLDEKLDKEPTLTDANTRAEEDAKNAAKTSKEYFDQLQNIQGNINNYNEGIRLIREEGANSGVIARRLPSLTAASQKLDNLRNRLGLDVVGGTTFGALSEAELAMALDTAMPSNLQPEQLAIWFEQRRDAQQKLADIIDGAIQFLNVPGNTLADLRAMQKSQRQPANTGGSGQGAATPGITAPTTINWNDLP